MKTYFRRFIKYLLFFIVIFVLINIPMFVQLRANLHGELTFSSFGFARFVPMFAIAVAVAMVYPLMLFSTKEVSISSKLLKKRSDIMSIIEKEGFIVLSEDGDRTLLRSRTKLRRILALNEDQMLIEFKETSIILTGFKKEVIRLSTALSLYIRKNEPVA